MRLRLLLSLCGLVWLGACAGVPMTPPADPPTDVRAEVRAVEQAFAATMARRDLAAFTDFIDDEAVFFSGAKALRGRAAVLAVWSAYFQGSDAPFSWAPETVEVLDSGSLALSSGPVHDAHGRLVARFTSIWRRSADGGWHIVFDKGSEVCRCKDD